MAPRAHWKGYLRVSLVSCPIALYPAIAASERISFKQVNRETGNRLRQQLVDSVTGEVVESHNKGRGYEVGENQHLMILDEDLETARQEARSRPFSEAPPRLRDVAQAEQPPLRRSSALESVEVRKPEQAVAPPPAPPRPIVENTRTIELDRFVPHDQIDPRYYNTPYYLAPRDEVGLEAFAVLRDAMTAKGLVGMGRIVLANRERPIIVEALGIGLRGFTLRYAHEVRSETEYFANIPAITLPEEMVRITEHLLETKKDDFDPTYLEDRYRTVLVEKLREKQAAMPARSVAPRPSPKNVINLMEALKRSLAAEQPQTGAGKSRRQPGGMASKPTSSKRSPARARKSG